ncbi:MAG: hypothetical protein Q9M36_00370 [Sulfurovum sp.]|nr:hypothetical protein [Sulfurovum sp.]
MDIFVSSHLEESLHYHNDKKVAQYQLSSLVYEYHQTEIVYPNLKTQRKASLFLNSIYSKTIEEPLTQGYTSLEALEETQKFNK